jgi:excisionase family DNA binding protein
MTRTLAVDGQPEAASIPSLKGIRIMEKLFTKKQLAEMLQISVRTVDRRIKSLNLPVFHVGRLVRIPESSLKLMITQEGNSDEELQKTINNLYGE